MAKQDVVVKAEKVKRWHKLGKFIKLAMLLLLLLLIIIYLVLKVLFNGGSFVVTLDNNEMLYSGLAMYETLNDPTAKRKLIADELQFMDNISQKWLPEDINKVAEGSHNGNNYIAYSFYLENQGEQLLDYWYSITMEDVINHADEIVRIMIYVNDDKVVYAKGNSLDGKPEKGTVKFRDDDDGTIILNERQDLRPGETDKITVVVWIEGDDPECTNALIGGSARFTMKITEEHDQETINSI